MINYDKTKLAGRVLNYFNCAGYRIELFSGDSGKIEYPTLIIYKIKGNWKRRFQTKTVLFTYRDDRMNTPYDKFLAHFIDWYCSGKAKKKLRRRGGESDRAFPVSDTPEELSLTLAVRGY